MAAVSNIAALVVDRFQLNPPVDIVELVQSFADLEFCSWPSDCDGVAILSTNRPKVFVKSGQPHRRERFTLAHELGHIVIPWHFNVVDCKPADTQEVASEESYLGIHNEAEANDFASRVLVPDVFMEELRYSYAGPSEILAQVEQADVSAAAGVLAVRRALLPGYVFVVPDLIHPVRSEGTEYITDVTKLRKAAVGSGVTQHQGKDVEWYQLAEAVEPTVKIATRDAAKEALLNLAESFADDEAGMTVQILDRVWLERLERRSVD